MIYALTIVAPVGPNVSVLILSITSSLKLNFSKSSPIFISNSISNVLPVPESAFPIKFAVPLVTWVEFLKHRVLKPYQIILV